MPAHDPMDAFLNKYMADKVAKAREDKQVMEGLTEGRIVHYIMPGGKHRPAIIVNVHDQETGSVNLQVFLDNLNDNAGMDFNVSQHEAGLRWITSVLPDQDGKQDDTWHWIERA